MELSLVDGKSAESTLITDRKGVSSKTLTTRNGRRGSLVRVILKLTWLPEDLDSTDALMYVRQV